MSTIKDVAKVAGCSISTVSYALNNDKRIPDITADRIKKIASEIGYFPSAAARNLKKRNTDTVLVAISDFGGPVYHELLDGIHYQLAKNGYTMIVSTGVSSDNLLKERSADGAIITDIHISDETLTQLAKNFRPIIVLDRSLKDTNIYNMTIDNHAAMFELTKDIISKGYKHIAFVHGVKDTYDNSTRFSGFLEAIQKANLKLVKEYYGNFTKPSGVIIAHEILKATEQIDMLVCANDEMAIGIIETLQQNGKEIPKDYGICGFDDIELSSYISPKLTSIKINHFEWGKAVAKTLVHLLKDEDVITKKEKGILKIRESY
ncbi:MAG: LacI family DNA-binding transcriptional regulator [Candidatus Izemoplasmatales bacterium]|nr:LacI family DNA-binding transcriptional regulator [Candidatus Izemoplasmatales bacterium]